MCYIRLSMPCSFPPSFLLIHPITLHLTPVIEPGTGSQHLWIDNLLSSAVSIMETVFNQSLKKLKLTEVEMHDDGHHSSKAIVLAHAVSKGRFSDADYLNTTFPVMVECLFCPGTAPQPIVFCLADTLAEMKGACMIAFAQDEDFPVVVEVIWANNGLPFAVGPLEMSERNVKATLTMLKVRAGVDVLRVHSEKSYKELKTGDEAWAT